MFVQPTSDSVGGLSALTTSIDKILGARSEFKAEVIKVKDTANDMFKVSGPEVAMAYLTSTIDLRVTTIDMALDMIDMLKTRVDEANIHADELLARIDNLKAINDGLKNTLAESMEQYNGVNAKLDGFNVKLDALLEKL